MADKLVFKYFSNGWSSGIFMHNSLQSLPSKNKCLVDDIGQRRMARRVPADRKAQITTLYSRGEQNSIWACQTLRRMLFRRPHQGSIPLDHEQDSEATTGTKSAHLKTGVQAMFTFSFLRLLEMMMMRLEGERRCVKHCNGISHSFIIKLDTVSERKKKKEQW